jgi:hypothetical protein
VLSFLCVGRPSKGKRTGSDTLFKSDTRSTPAYIMHQTHHHRDLGSHRRGDDRDFKILTLASPSPPCSMFIRACVVVDEDNGSGRNVQSREHVPRASQGSGDTHAEQTHTRVPPSLQGVLLSAGWHLPRVLQLMLGTMKSLFEPPIAGEQPHNLELLGRRSAAAA